MASHVVIKPQRHAGVDSQDRIYISGAAIVEGAPVVFSSGKVVTATDAADGPTSGIVGFALNACAAANEDCLVALALPGRRFKASLASNTADAQSDSGANAIALSDIGASFGLHADATTLKWVLGDEANGACVCTGLIDKVGATTIDTRSFGASGSPTGVTPSANVPPGATFVQDPTGSNTGQAQIEFIVKNAATIYA